MAAKAGLTGVPLRPAITFSMAFIVPSDRPLSPVTQAFATLVTTDASRTRASSDHLEQVTTGSRSAARV